MAQYRSPTPLNFEEPKWDAWRSQFMTFRLVTKLNEENEKVQIASLKYCMGMEAEEIERTFNLTEEERNVFNTVLTKFDEYFKPKVNVIRMRRIFQRRTQQANENEESYFRALYNAAQDCEFGCLKKERIRDQFISGILDETLAEKLEHLYMSKREDFTLDLVIEYTRTYCDIKIGRKQEKKEMKNEEYIDQVNKRGAVKFFNSATQQPACNYCGAVHNRNSCPAYGKNCAICGKLNHFARVCRSRNKKSKQLHEVTETEEDYNGDTYFGDNNYFLGECVNNLVSDSRWNVNIIISGTTINFKVDTGADVTVINYLSYCKLTSQPLITACDKKLLTPAGELKYLGTTKVIMIYKNVKFHEVLYVMSPGTATNNLLSRQAAQRLNIVRFIGDISIDDSLFGFGQWETEPVKLFVRNDVSPSAIHSARKVPFSLMEPVKAALTQMVEDDIIEIVTVPTDWASGMVPVVKPGKSKVRICVDFRKLNISLKREIFHIPTFDELSVKLAGVKIFSKLDAASGFFQIPLEETSRNYTTFLTPFGRYRFKRMPMGINTAPEIYQRKMFELLGDVSGVLIYMDDVIVYGSSEEQHNNTLKIVLDRIKRCGLKLNKAKCEFNKREIEFLGHKISDKGIFPSPDKIKAVQKLKSPENINELRRVLGLFNFVTKFVHNAQINLSPLNELLKKENGWRWDSMQEDAFNKMKVLLTTAPALAYFEPCKEIIVSADASAYALGAVLLQRHGKVLRPVAYSSRSLNKSEKNYAQIEKELLASVWACEKFRMYLQGVKFILQSDHKPLIPLINNKNLADAPVRCQRLLMRLARYSPSAEYVPGKYMVIADTLSRDVHNNNNSVSDLELSHEIEEFTIQYINSLPASETKLRAIVTEQNNDNLISVVKNYIKDGWPHAVDKCLSEYYEVRGELSVVQDMLVFRDRIVIPYVLRKDILKRIHDDGHLSLDKCRKRAQSSVWWPLISKELSEYIERCNFCQINRRKHKSEPLKPTRLPDRPWQQLALDLFDLKGDKYLIVVDYFSRWFEVVKMARIDSESVIYALKKIFSIFGIPDIVKSDRGLQFNSASFKNFAHEYDFVLNFSDPFYPQGNGCAERAVQVAKRLYKQPDPLVALMSYRSTPLDTTGCTPSQLLMGRNIRTKLPTLPANLSPFWPDLTAVRNNDNYAKERSAELFNKRKGARKLPELVEGQAVRIRLPLDKQWSQPENVLLRRGETSYAVRNRKYLQPIPEPFDNKDAIHNNKTDDSDCRPVAEREESFGDDCIRSPSTPVSPVPVTNDNLSPKPSYFKTRSGRISKPVVKYQA